MKFRISRREFLDILEALVAANLDASFMQVVPLFQIEDHNDQTLNREPAGKGPQGSSAPEVGADAEENSEGTGALAKASESLTELVSAVNGRVQEFTANIVDGANRLVAGVAGWDFFLFGSLEGESPGPARVGFEGVGLLGYNSNGGLYGGNIAAGGFQVGSAENYYAHYSGEEINSISGNTGITLTYVNVGAEIPFIAGEGGGYGNFDTESGEHGSFMFVGAKAFGLGGSIGFGWSIEALRTLPSRSGKVGDWL